MTGSELALGLLGLAEFAPSALLVFVTGPVADRFDRRRVAAIGIVIEAVFVLALAGYAGSDPTSTLPIFLLVIAYGTARAFAFPASSRPPRRHRACRPPALAGGASVDQLAGGLDRGAGARRVPLRRQRAAPLSRGCRPARSCRGDDLPGAAALPRLAPEPVASEAVETELGTVAVGEPAEAVVGTRTRRQGMRDAMEGLRFVRSEPVLLGAISLDLVAVLFGGAVALLPASRRRPSRRGRGRSRVAPRRRRDRRRARDARARVQTGDPARGVDDADRGRDLRRRDDRPRLHHELRDRVRGAGGAVGCGRGQRVHPRHADTARDPAGQTRARAGGGDRLHRGVERAGRVRIRCVRSAARARGRDRDRRCADAWPSHSVGAGSSRPCVRWTGSPKGSVVS